MVFLVKRAIVVMNYAGAGLYALSEDHMNPFPKKTYSLGLNPLASRLCATTCLSLALLVPAGRARAAAPEEGVAVAIIYDTSGSMKEPVMDAFGGTAPKYQIANRALKSVVGQLEAFATNNSGHKQLEAGLFVFQGERGREAVKLGPLDAEALRQFADSFSRPQGNTPLGNTVAAAARALLSSPLAHKHMLVITDGLNTAGPAPDSVLPRLKAEAGRQNASLNFHFVAFDVDARQFAAVKRQGATVVGAMDEKQLNLQLQFILRQKILLEDEETPKKP